MGNEGLGEHKLFMKIPTDLYRLWSSNLSAHKHRDTVLFKKSMGVQRRRFHGTKKLNEIVYGNSR